MMPTSRKSDQPDFQALFFDHFGPTPRRQIYRLRFNTSNLHHDVVFLASLMHDARFLTSAIRKRGSRVLIDSQRDTWETGSLARPGAPYLHYVPSRLSVEGVVGIEWRFQRSPVASDEELWLTKLTLERLGDDTGRFQLGLHGYEWQLVLTLDDEKAAVVLRDTGDPRSHQQLP
jgi:hypothetical protein